MKKQTIEINIKDKSGKKHVIQMSNYGSVGLLKDLIELQTSFNKKSQVLVHNKRRLFNTETLIECLIEDGSTLDLFISTNRRRW